MFFRLTSQLLIRLLTRSSHYITRWFTAARMLFIAQLCSVCGEECSCLCVNNMDFIDYFDYEQLPRVRARAQPGHRNFNPFNLSEEEFRDRFRFTKAAVNQLIELLSPRLGVPSRRARHAIPNWKKVLIALRYFAVGAFHRETGDLLGCSESVACKYVHEVALAICLEMKTEYIKFPTGEYVTSTKNKFYQMYGFPGVLSCLDGSHIKIMCPPTQDKEEYRNRKGDFSINMLGAAGADLEFTFIVGRWKGRTHDSQVLKNSSLYARFEEHDMGGLLLGDSGYECNRFLMTPLLRPNTPAEMRDERAHIRTRSTVKRMFGLFKNRFRCLHNNNALRFRPRRCCIIIVACAVLHNIGLRRDVWVEEEPMDEEMLDIVDEQHAHPQQHDLQEGIFTRNELIQRHFAE